MSPGNAKTSRKEEGVLKQSEEIPGYVKVSALGGAGAQWWQLGGRKRPKATEEGHTLGQKTKSLSGSEYQGELTQKSSTVRKWVSATFKAFISGWQFNWTSMIFFSTGYKRQGISQQTAVPPKSTLPLFLSQQNPWFFFFFFKLDTTPSQLTLDTKFLANKMNHGHLGGSDGWASGLTWAQIKISGSWDQAPRQAPHSEEVLVPLLFPACSCSYACSLSNKYRKS